MTGPAINTSQPVGPVNLLAIASRMRGPHSRAMRTLFLYGLKDAAEAAAWLDQRLPRDGDAEWTLGDGDHVWARLRIGEPELYGDASDLLVEPGSCLWADLSGRLPDRREVLVAVLQEAQAALGGVIRDDNDKIVQGAVDR